MRTNQTAGRIIHAVLCDFYGMELEPIPDTVTVLIRQAFDIENALVDPVPRLVCLPPVFEKTVTVGDEQPIPVESVEITTRPPLRCASCAAFICPDAGGWYHCAACGHTWKEKTDGEQIEGPQTGKKVYPPHHVQTDIHTQRRATSITAPEDQTKMEIPGRPSGGSVQQK